MTRDTSAVDYQDLARELDDDTQPVGGDSALAAGSLERTNAPLVRATSPASTRGRLSSRDDTLAALHAARRAAEKQRALVRALEDERAQ